MKRAVLICAGLGALLAFSAAVAQQLPAVPAVPGMRDSVVPVTPPAGTPPAAAQRYRGTIQELNGPFLTLKIADRKTVTVGVAMTTRVIHNRLLQLSDLQAGWYIGVAALKGADGKLRAQGIRVYPAQMRGQGEGEYPVEAANPARLLINGDVASVTPGGIGGVFTVSFHGGAADAAGACFGRAVPGGCTGTAEIQFARGVPIIAIEGGDASMLQQGATVTATVTPDASGTLVASAITVERDAPPPKLVKP